MKYRIFEIAHKAGVSSQDVINYLQSKGEFVRSASSAIEEPVANKLLAHFGANDIDLPAINRSVDVPRSITPATTYTWQANPVKPPQNSDVLNNVKKLETLFPVAAKHGEMLKALGSQFVYAKTMRASDGKNLGIALARFSGAIESAFGITREVMFFYAPYYDLQIRTFTKAQEILTQLPRQATPDLVLFSAPDDRLTIKLEDWSRLNFTAIPLDSKMSKEPINIVRVIRDHIYARDLFYETTPVRGNRFFGRKTLLQELKDDIDNQRVSGVFGLRKSGKTSVLLQLAELMESDFLMPVFIDLEVLPSPPHDPTTELISVLASRLNVELSKRNFEFRELDQLISNPSARMLKEVLEPVFAQLGKQGIRIVFLLDEIEFLTPSDQMNIAEGEFSGVAQVLGILRSLVQGGDNFTFLLSGLTNDILESGRLYGRPNPLFSWAKARYIGPFSRLEADELATAIGSRMGIEIESGALRALYDGSGGHAYLYRSLASAVVSELPVDTYRRVMRLSDILHKIIPWKRSIAGNLDEILGHLARYYATESILLEVLMESPEDFAELAASEDRAVHHLTSLGLIHESFGKYTPSSLLELK